MHKNRAENVHTTIAALIDLQNEAGFFTVYDAANRPVQNITSDVLLANAELLALFDTIQNTSLQQARERLAAWLAQTITTHNTFNQPEIYSARATFYTLARLHEHDPILIPQALLAQAIQYLVTHEAAVGGPYKNEVEEIDYDTNVAIDHFVRQVAQPLPKLTAYITNIQTKTRDTWYTPARIYLTSILNNSPNIQDITTDNTNLTQLRSSIIKAIHHDLQTVPAPLRTNMQKLITCIIESKASNEIIALAAHFAKAFTSASTPTDITDKLGVANTYTWIAYTLYDDFLDGEGQPHKLPLANVALRHGLTAFQQALPNNNAFQKYIIKVFNTIEVANAWEVSHCRWHTDGTRLHAGKLPEYGDLRKLCERSLSHSLPVIGVLAAHGASLTSRMVRDVTAAFKTYLIIRQLSDDLRDWRDDIQAGHISYVVARLLQETGVPQKPILFSKLLPKLDAYFWHTLLPALNLEIQTRGKQARALLHKHRTSIAPDNVLSTLIQELEHAAQRTRNEQQRADQFLQAYQQN